MSATISPVPEDVYAALGAFIQLVLGGGYQVVRGIANRVPMVSNPDPAAGFCVMTAIFQQRLSTNVDTYVDGYPNPPQTVAAEESREIDIQLDFYGTVSAAQATEVEVLFRDEYGCGVLAPKCQPLYADEARMIPLVDGEEQWEERWTLTAVLQYNPVVTSPQQFAGAAAVNVINVEEAYPP